MAITDLTGTKWVLNNSLTAYAGGSYSFKNYDVNITSDEATEGINANPTATDSFVKIGIGYSSGIESNQVCFYPVSNDTYVWATGNDTTTLPDTWNNVITIPFTITGGTDATNSALISWLESNATMKVDDVVVSYNGSTIATLNENGTEVLETNGKLCSDDITVAYTRTNGSATTPDTTITANPSISVSSGGLITTRVGKIQSVTPTVSAGYVSSGTAGTITVSGSNRSQMATQAAQTIHPSTTDQTIASGKYLTGAQTVKGVLLTNLSAGNIKKDVVVKVGDSTDDDCVTSVTGTFEGGGVPNIQSLSVTQNGTYTASGGVDGYSPVTVNVSGGSSVEPKDVNFIDYDGTLLHSYTKTEFANLSDLPSNPSHTGLTAQGWNWTKSQITAQLTAVPDAPVWVGQMYITTSGASEIDIKLDDPAHLSPYLTIAVNGTVSVDWGDNSTPSTVTGVSLTTLRYTLHEYASTGDYTIKISVTSGTFNFYNNNGANQLKSSVLSVYGSDSNRRYDKRYSDTINAIRIGSGVTRIWTYAFADCNNLQSITIPSSVTSIAGNSFQYCHALESITIPNGVTSIDGYAFQYCCSLRSISVPSGATSIKNNAFYYCYSLQSITIPSGVTSIGNSAFYYCCALQSISIPSGVTSIGSSAFYYCCALQSISVPSGVTSIGSSTFYYCYSLQSISIPSGVTSIGSYAFQSCRAIQSITIPSSITSFSTYAFANCYSLQSITIPSSVTTIGNYALANCTTLQSITIPSSVTTIGNNAFAYCYGALEYHFQRATPPTLGTSAFNNIVPGTIIYVPSASLTDYQTASNWSTYASYMQGE